jgi:hypothetical protein
MDKPISIESYVDTRSISTYYYYVFYNKNPDESNFKILISLVSDSKESDLKQIKIDYSTLSDIFDGYTPKYINVKPRTDDTLYMSGFFEDKKNGTQKTAFFVIRNFKSDTPKIEMHRILTQNYDELFTF